MTERTQTLLIRIGFVGVLIILFLIVARNA